VHQDALTIPFSLWSRNFRWVALRWLTEARATVFIIGAAFVLPLGLQRAGPYRRSIYRRCWLPALLFEKGNIRDIAVAECRCPQLFIR